MRAKKRNLKAVPKIVGSEKQTALKVGRMIARGEDPLAISEHSIGGIFRFHVKDIAAFFELTGRKYDIIHTSFQLEDENDTYIRRLK